MAEYRIIISQSASKELSKLPVVIIRRIQTSVNALASDPRPTNCKKLKGHTDLYSIRVGDYRVVY
ncbi:type II toxin-antitoxin system RelE/ParE family toxin [Spirosoma montaniterrae]|uniref:type II toxin-antitoxin system RelE family toxin n=1 Tax=Spirosoma montaniterrae TaxID=1178516 RepID=UPI0018DB5043